VEFFPASIAAIIRYLEAEITRGTWKNVLMNGTDWPSPAEALSSFGSEVKEVLEHIGVHIEKLHPGIRILICVPTLIGTSHFS
jgi:hypothetical protein